LPEQKKVTKKGGTMRLGKYLCEIKRGTLAEKSYRKKFIYERHRHRYELNNKFRNLLEKNGLIISGIHPEKNLAEIIELKNHPWFVGVQFHPEFLSRPLRPHPLFINFIKSAKIYKNSD
jgi:CTP synthase